MQQEHTRDLEDFVEACKLKSASDEFLTTFLTRQGWPQDDVYAALASHWERATGLAVPARTSGGESSRDAFLYLLSFSTLATWSGALGSMLFRLIERWLPDPVTRDTVYNLRNEVTWQMASVAVAFPIFLLVTRAILREAQDHPERLQSGVRRWLTYIALLLTAGAMICDLIWFFDYFLTGELTTRFVLKAFTVMAICGAIFAYYLGSLRWDRNTDVAQAKRRSLAFGIAATAVVALAFFLGLGVAGTPAEQRHLEADLKRVQDLRAIANAIHLQRQREDVERTLPSLPATLNDLAGKGVLLSQLLDPETKAFYEYRIQSGSRYQLCAIFSSSEESNQPRVTQFWFHGKGRSCFTFDASQPPVW